MPSSVFRGVGQSVGEGSYRLLSSIGLGGFGEVFLAEGPNGLVAVKVVETAAWTEREYRVFNALMVSEASYLSTLNHRALPKLRAFFAEETRYFLVMDWVSGLTLEESVRNEGRLSLAETLRLTEGLLEVFAYLHEGCRPSVVFGDLKPANVLRTFEGDYRLVDLGLATREGAYLTGDFAVYSPPYSAPERALGEPSRISHDVYSLSSTIFFALTGVGPPASTAPHLVAEVALRRALARDLESEGEVESHRLGQLFTLVLAGLNADPDARPRSLSALREAFENWRSVSQGDSFTRDSGKILRGLYALPRTPSNPGIGSEERRKPDP